MIPQMEPTFGLEERGAVYRYVQSDGWLTEYKKTRELEAMIAGYVGSDHCIMVPNATLGLYAALIALGVGPGDDVIVPAFTMVATANAVVMTGAIPNLVDISLKNLCLDPEKAWEAITPRTKGIILVSLNGRSPNMGALWLGLQHRIPGGFLLEDAAQSLGSFHNGTHLGTWGDAGVFSFSCQKIITTGNGGCVVTSNDELARKLRLFKDFGREQGGTDHYKDIGINLKFTDLQAVVGIEQVKKLPARVKRKKGMYALYRSYLADLPQIGFVPTDLDNTTPWFVDVLVKDRAALMAHLAKGGVGTRAVYPALTSLWFYSGLGDTAPLAELVSNHGLWLPSSCKLDDAQIKYVCDQIRAFYDT